MGATYCTESFVNTGHYFAHCPQLFCVALVLYRSHRHVSSIGKLEFKRGGRNSTSGAATVPSATHNVRCARTPCTVAQAALCFAGLQPMTVAFVGSDILCIQAARYPVSVAAVDDPCCMELRWKEAGSSRHRQGREGVAAREECTFHYVVRQNIAEAVADGAPLSVDILSRPFRGRGLHGMEPHTPRAVLHLEPER